MNPLIAVTSCHRYDYRDKNNKDHPNQVSSHRIDLVRSCWACYAAQHGFDLKIFYGELPEGSQRTPKEDEIFLEAPDDYYRLPKKTQSIFKWALNNNYKNVLKVDDDVFVNLVALKDCGYESNDYTGYVVQQDFSFASGAAYWLSEKSMERVVDTHLDYQDYDSVNFNHADTKWADDKWVGSVLCQYGLPPVHNPLYRVCLCPVCWKDGLDYYTVHVTPRLELMKTLEQKRIKI